MVLASANAIYIPGLPTHARNLRIQAEEWLPWTSAGIAPSQGCRDWQVPLRLIAPRELFTLPG